MRCCAKVHTIQQCQYFAEFAWVSLTLVVIYRHVSMKPTFSIPNVCTMHFWERTALRSFLSKPLKTFFWYNEKWENFCTFSKCARSCDEIDEFFGRILRTRAIESQVNRDWLSYCCFNEIVIKTITILTSSGSYRFMSNLIFELMLHNKLPFCKLDVPVCCSIETKNQKNNKNIVVIMKKNYSDETK